MFEGLLAKLAFGAMWSKVKTSAKADWQAIPPKARLWIIGIIALIVVAVAHQWYAHRKIKAAYKSGYDQAVVDIRAAEAKKVAPLKEAKVVADAQVMAATTQIRKTHDAQATHIDSNLADLLGMLDSSKGGILGGPVGDQHGGDAAAGSGRAASPTVDGLAQAGDPGDAAIVCVPAKGLFLRSAQADRDYNALTAWEDTYQAYITAYGQWLAKTRQIAH